MRIGQQVTFGGSGLDRAAEVRGDAAALAAAWRDPGCRVMALWRGKPLFRGTALVWLSADDPAIAGDGGGRILLGRDETGPLFAAELNGFAPADGSQPQAVFFDPTEQAFPAAGAGAVFAELRGRMAALSTRDAESAAMAKALFGWHQSHRFCAACGHASEVEMGGWQRFCPQCGARHFPRTDPVVIMLVTSGNSVLVGRSPGWPDGMYSLLAGFMEPGETIEAAVRREVHEETGVTVGPVDYLACQPWPYPSSLMIGCRAQALETTVTLDPVELEDAMWLSREDVARAFDGRHPRVRAPRAGAIAGFLLWNWLADRLD